MVTFAGLVSQYVSLLDFPQEAAEARSIETLQALRADEETNGGIDPWNEVR